MRHKHNKADTMICYKYEKENTIWIGRNVSGIYVRKKSFYLYSQNKVLIREPRIDLIHRDIYIHTYVCVFIFIYLTTNK